MIKQLKKWLQDQKNIVQKTAGVQEKEEATKKKMEVAMSILDRREEKLPVDYERRLRKA